MSLFLYMAWGDVIKVSALSINDLIESRYSISDN
jgi:hypothetical protein